MLDSNAEKWVKKAFPEMLVHIYYSMAGEGAKNILVRYAWHGQKLMDDTRKVVLEAPVQREECCHVGGGRFFDKDKNLT